MAQWTIYDAAREFIGDGTVDLDDHVFKIDLLATTYTPSATGDSQKTDVAAHVLSGSGYSTVTLANVQWLRIGGMVDWRADDAVFQASGGTLRPRYAIVWDEDAANDELVLYSDLGLVVLNDDQRLRVGMGGAIQ